MEPSAQRTRQGLGLEVIIQRRPVSPYLIAAKLDQTGPKHDTEDKPAEQRNDRHGWLPTGKRPPVEQRTEEDRKKSCLQQLDLPPVSIPFLADIDKGHIKEPEHSHDGRICKPCQDDTG